MTNPVVVKQTLRMGMLSIAQAVGLPLVASLLLAIEMLLFGVPIDLPFVLLLTFVVVLGVPLMQPERGMMTQLIGGRRRLVTRIALRWLLLLCVLLAIGYATKSSDHFSRGLLLTWAVTTPPLLMGLALLMHEALNRMLSDPASARRAIFVGYNEISVSLAQRVERTSSAALRVAGFFDDRAPHRLGAGGRHSTRDQGRAEGHRRVRAGRTASM